MKGLLATGIVLILLLLASCSSQQQNSSEDSSASSQLVISASSSSQAADTKPQVKDGYTGSYVYAGTDGQNCGFTVKLPEIDSQKAGAVALNQQIAAKYNYHRTAVENKTNNGQSLWEVFYETASQGDYITLVIHEKHNNDPGEPNLDIQVINYNYKLDKTATTSELLASMGETSTSVISKLKAKVEASQSKSRVTEEDWKDWIPPINETWLSEVQADINKLSLWYQNGTLWVCYIGNTMEVDGISILVSLT